MWTAIKEYRHYILAVLLVILPLIALNTSNREPAKLYWWDKGILRLVAPVQGALSWVIGFVGTGVGDYFLLLDVKQNSKKVTLENRRLLHELDAFEELALENERLRKLMKFSRSTQGNKIMAQVIAQDILSAFRTVRLNKGSADGVTKGMAAVTYEGIVGRVLRVDSHYSDVLTLVDSSSNVASLIQRNRTRGLVEGYEGNVLRMKYVRRTDDIQVGDNVMSSGIGGLFPKGVMIGKVVKVTKKSYGLTQNIEVHPSVDFSTLEEVMIIKPQSRVESKKE